MKLSDLSIPRLLQALRHHTVSPSGCWEYSGRVLNTGYGEMRVRQGDARHPFKIHRAAYYLRHGVDPGPLMVCHDCDVRHCINPEHLFLGTGRDNAKDMISKFRGATQSSPFTQQYVRSRRGVDSAITLEASTGLHRSTIYRIWNASPLT